MSMNLEIKPVDSEYYQKHIEDFLPESIIDIHTHVWLASERGEQVSRVVSWTRRVADESPIEQLLETYQWMLPGKNVMPLIFSNPTLSTPVEQLNKSLARAAGEHKLPALALTQPQWSAEKFEQAILAPGFVGSKVYLTFAPKYIPSDEIRIFDFIPPHHLDVLHQHGRILMLHIPRSGRLRDEVNLAQMMEIDRRWPNARVIIAHVGRAYCEQDVGRGMDVLADSNLLIDFSANTNEVVFEQMLGKVPASRILFGSDLPIVRMRMRRICENGRYINLVPKGLYGDVSADANMREVSGDEADSLSFFLYEQLYAFRRAAESAGLSRNDVQAVFHGNAQELLSSITR